MAYKLGRRAPDYSRPRLWLEDYKVAAPIPAPVYPVDYATGVTWPMYLNNTLGDCTIAGMAHAEGAWSKIASGTELVFTDDVIQSVYSAVGGYVPGHPDTDQGCVMQAVLSYWQNTGINGHRISAFAQLVNGADAATLNWALQVFGTVYTGINCPASAQQQFGSGGPWTYVQGSQILGGHCVVLQGNSAPGLYEFVTWGALQPVTQDFVDHYVEEAWVAISPDWLDANGATVTGLDLAQLTDDMTALAA